MVGSFDVRVSRRRGASYRFTVTRNITVVRGDSGTGKTTLYEMLADHTRLGERSGVTVKCDCPCVALTDIDWRNQLGSISSSIVFVDEGLEEISSTEFAGAVKGSDNYYVIFTRSELPMLPYSVNEVYRIKTSGKYHTFEPMYKPREGFRYSLSRARLSDDFDCLLTEDSKSGFQFFEARFEGEKIECHSAMTNSNVFSWLVEHPDDCVFVVADGAAFGPYADRVLKLQLQCPNRVTVCLPESFEWLLLRSGIVRSDGLTDLLDSPSAFIDSAEFESWEQFFTDLLEKATRGTPLAYSKKRLAAGYVAKANADKVMSLIAFKNIQ